MLCRIPTQYKTKVLRRAAGTAIDEAKSNVAILQIMRWDPSTNTQKVDSYEWHRKQDFMVLDLLTAVKAHQDPTLTYRASCCEGICGSCAMNINGINSLACITYATPHTIVGPLPNFPIIRDLVVDLRHFFSQYAFIRPFIRNPNLSRYKIGSIVENYERMRKAVYGETTKAVVQPSTATQKGYEEQGKIYDTVKVLLERAIEDGDVPKTITLLKLMEDLGVDVTLEKAKKCVQAAIRDEREGSHDSTIPAL